MATITRRVPEAMAAPPAALARGGRRPKSAAARAALAARPKAKEKPGAVRAYDLVKSLCGCLQGGPSDLATNPEHLRGFGG